MGSLLQRRAAVIGCPFFVNFIKKAMKILFHVPQFLPNHNSGAEWTSYEYAKICRDAGHEVVFITMKGIHSDYDGFRIVKQDIKRTNDNRIDRLYIKSDIVFTQLNAVGWALNLSRKHKKPVVNFLHNTMNKGSMDTNSHVGIVYNAEWVKRFWESKEKPNKNKSIVCYPPIDFERFEALQGRGRMKYITMINVNENKGGNELREMAKIYPDDKFMAVIGSYGVQVRNYTKNVKIVENSKGIDDILLDSMVILCKSKYESFGRVALEAIAAGREIDTSNAEGFVELGLADGVYSLLQNETIVKYEALKNKMLLQQKEFINFIQKIHNESKEPRSKWIRWD